MIMEAKVASKLEVKALLGKSQYLILDNTKTANFDISSNRKVSMPSTGSNPSIE
jgi:hypothetical protein